MHRFKTVGSFVSNEPKKPVVGHITILLDGGHTSFVESHDKVQLRQICLILDSAMRDFYDGKFDVMHFENLHFANSALVGYTTGDGEHPYKTSMREQRKLQSEALKRIRGDDEPWRQSLRDDEP